MTVPRPPALTLQPMVHVNDMSAAVDFLTRLGGTLRHGSDDGDWALVEIAGSELSLLAHPPNPEQDEGIVELNFQAGAPLEEVEASLRAAGVAITAPITELFFGRQLQVTTPDGLLVKINELGPVAGAPPDPGRPATQPVPDDGGALPDVTDETMHARLAEARAYTLALLHVTERWSRPAVDATVWEHGRRNMALVEAGRLHIVLPVSDDSALAGVGVFAGDLAETTLLLDGDPAVQAGILRYELHPVRGFPGASLP